jgi:hypothetical protein
MVGKFREFCGTLALVAFALIVLAGCGGDSSDPATRPGSPAVWARIENGTDCAALQSEFDTAMDNAEARESGDPYRDLSLDYAKAADDRMEEVGCYG